VKGQRQGKRKPQEAIDVFQGQLGPRESLRRLRSYLKPLWLPLTVGLVFTLLWSSANLGYGWIAARFLDTIKDMKGSGRMQELNFLTVVGIMVFAGRALVYFVMNYSWSYAAQRLSMRMRNEVFRHLQELPVAFFDHRKTGQLMSTLANDIPALNAVLDALKDCISAPALLIGGIGVLFWLNWPLAIISCICLPPIAAIIVRATKRMRAYTAQLQNHLSHITEHAEETLAGVRVVKSFGNEDYEVDRFDRRSDSVFRSVLRTIRVRQAMTPLVELLGAVAIILVLWVAGNQIINDPRSTLTFGKLTFFVLVLRQVADGSKNLGGISINLSAAAVAADRVFTLLDIKSDIQEHPKAVDLQGVKGRVTFEDVAFAYRSGIPVLKDISFVIEPGEVVAVVGPTGAGKTTIAALIPRFYDVTSGKVTVDGYDVRDCTLKSLRHCIGIVPQDTVLFAGTLRENIAYGRLGSSDEEVEAAARMANAWEFIERMPDGIDTLIGERGARLSGGQRQRIAIARAILRDPRILILDEATSSLDTQSEALVQDALQRLVANRTTLVIAHRLSTIRNADKILVLKEGLIVEAGRHSELLAHGGVYSDLYRTQFRWDDAERPREALE
jgi:subfamily B ATP-binding cassette protein MsbA